MKTGTSRQKTERILGRGDAVAMMIFMAFGIAIVAVTTIAAALRIAEVLPNRNVRVLGEFTGTPVDAPIGPNGASVPIELDTAWITAPELPLASVWAIVAQQLIMAATVTVVVICLLIVTWGILRGRLFSRRHTILITTAGLVGFVGSVLAPFFGNMGSNGAFAVISDYTFNNVIATFEVLPFVFLAFLAALASLTFSVGEHLQRDTEGLV